MMTGHVVQRHALLPVTFRLPHLRDVAIEFVVDTGFSGALTLPLAAVQAMQLRYEEDILANVATDEEVQTPVYSATILWEGVNAMFAYSPLVNAPCSAQPYSTVMSW